MKILALDSHPSILVLLLAVLGLLGGQAAAETPAQGTLRVAVYPTTYTRLIAIASRNGYFRDAGVDVVIEKYPSGTAALTAVVNGEADIGTVVDFRFAWEMLRDPLIRAVASTGEVLQSRIIARKSKDLLSPTDLKGKRIGFVPNTISEYTLYSFLLEHDIAPSEIEAVPIELLQQTEAVTTGNLDAVSAFATFAIEAEDKLGDQGLTWNSEFHSSYNALLVVKEGPNLNPLAVSAFLKALIEAEQFSHKRENAAKKIVMMDLGMTRDKLDDYWDRTLVTVSLSQSVVASLNLYAKWFLETRQLDTDMPNVLTFVNTSPLARIAPERVSVFR